MTLRSASDAPPRVHALVPCAGIGERAGAGGPKQYAMLGARSLLGHTLQALSAVGRLASLHVLVAAGDTLHATHLRGTRARAVACGGATRADTVRNGLAHLLEQGAGADEWALVHDAARCLVRPDWIDVLVEACLADPVGGLLALPVADTLKQQAPGGRHVAATLDRQGKWQAQTPQMFRIGPLLEALRGAGAGATDEAGAMEALGHAPLLVPGALENFKITWPADFALAERLLRTRT